MIRVAVVDDHPVFRQGLAHAVEATGDFELVAAVSSVEDLAASPAAELVILDLGLPGMSGTDAVRRVCETGAKVLVVSAGADQHDVLNAVAAGASGYLTKSAEPDEITAAARLVAAGGTYVSPTLAAYVLRAAKTDAAAGPHTLTDREREVLALVAAGERHTDIADQLFISARTVRSHLDRIRDKTGHRRRADLTRLAVQEGVVRGHPDRN